MSNDSVFQSRFSWTGDGQISIATDKGAYVAGEKITGRVRAKITQPVQAGGIVLRVSGFEKVEWNAVRSRREPIPNTEPQEYKSTKECTRHRGKKTFFKQTLELYNLQNGTLMPGQYDFPFEYQLPDNLPGSFFATKPMSTNGIDEFVCADDNDEEDWYDSDDEQDDDNNNNNNNNGGRNNKSNRSSRARPKYAALVMYKLKAMLDLTDGRRSDLFAAQPVIVHEKLDNTIQPASVQRVAEVRSCGCFPRGKCTINASFDKNCYAPGETAQIEAVFNNESPKAVDTSVNLIRTLRLTSSMGKVVSFSEQVASHKYDEVEGNSGMTRRPMPLSLTGENICPSTSGTLVQCSFTYNVRVEVSMAPDIHANMPVVLYAPQPQQWGVQANW